MITETQRKTLTEWLGECWHEWAAYGHADFDICKECGEIERISNHKNNRTFDNWDDFGAVVEKLGWLQAVDYIIPQIPSEINSDEIPERFCILVAEAIDEGILSVDKHGAK